MDEYTRAVFGRECPYTGLLCTDDLPCYLCEEEQYERKFMEEEDE